MNVLHAGALTMLVQQGLSPALLQTCGIVLNSEPGHSVALARAIKEQRVSGDMYFSADVQVNQILLGSTNGDWIRWFVTFAHNAVVLAYSPKSQFLNSFEQAHSGVLPWYQALLQPGVKLRRNDPNLDPLGYYTLLVCALAQEHYRLLDLKERLLGDDTNSLQIDRSNIAHLERGEIDAMFLYLSAARERGLPYLPLPDEINLSNPALASTYASVHYTTTTGEIFFGKPISFSAAMLSTTKNPRTALHVIAYLLSPAGQKLVQAAHLLPSPALVGGDETSVPDQLRPLLQGKYQFPD